MKISLKISRIAFPNRHLLNAISQVLFFFIKKTILRFYLIKSICNLAYQSS